jgi:oligoendopeptidase F
MTWDLTPIVDGAKLPAVKKLIDERLNNVSSHLEQGEKYFDNANPAKLADFLSKYETLLVPITDALTYCNLSYSTDTTDKDGNQLNTWYLEGRSQLQSAQIVFELKLGTFLESNPDLINDDTLSGYRHFLERILESAPFQLTEKEETLTSAKDVNGINTMSQLQEAWKSQKIFEFEIEGERKTLTLSELSALRMDPDRDIREMATVTLYKSFAEDKLIHGLALKSICSDHVMMTKRRGLPSTMSQSLLSQDVEESAIEALLSTIENTASVFQDFLKLKAKLFGTRKLLGHDVIAPWSTDPIWRFEYSKARDIVVDSFSSFDPEIGSIIESMFSGNRIDAVNRVGKPNGAFCAGWYGAKKSFVFTNFNSTLNDTYTLAHENGHAAQGHLIYTHQSPLNYRSSSCMAECGSIFGELLLTNKILSISKTDTQRFEALSTTLNDYFYVVYYVGTRAIFEKMLYSVIEDGQNLDADLACELWNKAKRKIFGDAVDWTDYMEYEWARIPHFFIPNFRFYNYSYSFAQMLVYAVFEEYQKGGEDFNSRFKKLLASGSSKSPKEQIAEFGYNLDDPGFWKMGPSQAEHLLSELKKVI